MKSRIEDLDQVWSRHAKQVRRTLCRELLFFRHQHQGPAFFQIFDDVFEEIVKRLRQRGVFTSRADQIASLTMQNPWSQVTTKTK
jgi:hypothetical protein